MPPKSIPKPKPPPLNPYFKPGAKVEVNSDEVGFRGSFYSGTIVRRASTKTPNKYLVQYEKLFNDEEGTKPLREILDLGQLRPEAPREKKRTFKFSEEVDAYHNDGWWEGVITEECGDGKFAVFFRSTKEQIVFGEEDLRLHREWINEEWRPPLEEEEEEEEAPEEEGEPEEKKIEITTEVKPSKAMELEKSELQKVPNTTEVKPKAMELEKSELQKVPNTTEVMPEAPKAMELEKSELQKVPNATEVMPKAMELEKSELQKVPNATEVKRISAGSEEKFSKGALVEVSSDEDGFKGAWFAASIVEAVGKDKYLVEYQSLRTEDETDFLREEIDTLHIRPRPPETIVVGRFKLLEEVDALYQDGWWVGVISKVLDYPKYVVYFKDTKEEMPFEHSDLRVHQDWIDGKWVMASRALSQ